MARIIKSVKVTFSKIGVTSLNQPRQEVYVPMAKIQYEDTTRKFRTSILDPKGLQGESSEAGITKKNFRGLIICGSFFVAVCEGNRYYFFDSEAKPVASSVIEGAPIQVGEDGFIMRNGTTIAGYDITGKITGQRELTEEEINSLG